MGGDSLPKLISRAKRMLDKSCYANIDYILSLTLAHTRTRAYIIMMTNNDTMIIAVWSTTRNLFRRRVTELYRTTYNMFAAASV